MMHSWATRPLAPRYSTGNEPSSRRGDVVGRQDRHRGGSRQAGRRPSARCTSTGSAGCRPNRTARPTRRRPTLGVAADAPGRNGVEMGAHPDRPDAGPAAAVRDAERLVQVEMADVGAELARAGGPTSALRLAPSTYTCPPASWIMSQSRRSSVSNTPCVDGYVIMIAASRSPTEAILARRSARSTLPRSSQRTTTTSIPAITALAAFVPWALDGMRQTVRCVVAATAVVAADGEEPREFALAAGVGLHADTVVAGDRRQHRASRSAIIVV